MPENYYHVKWSAYADLDGTRIEISNFEIEYALDEIPTARFNPVVGRDGRTGKEAESVDALLNAAPYTPIKIYVKGETEEDSPQDEPGFPYDEDTLIFDGYYQGVTYTSQRQLGGGSVAIGATAAGWLVGLVGTSTRTTRTAVKGPGGFFEAATVGMDEENPNPTALFNLSAAVSGNPENSVDDLWLRYIKPLFTAIASTKEVWGAVENESALDALGRMDDSEQFGKAELTLSMKNIIEDLPRKIVGEWLTTTLAKRLFYNWRASTLWHALVSAARSYAFHIVPLIDTATCAPAFSALGGDAYIIVEPDEYHDVNISFYTPNLVTKVVVLANNLGHVSPYASAPRYSAVIGQASADDISDLPYEGIAICVNAPDWLATEPSIGLLAKVALGKDKFGIPDAANPDAFQYTPTDEEDYAKIYNQFLKGKMGDSYAKLVLLNEMCSSRIGGITGRFRLDVAPGSTIAVGVVGGGKFSDSQEPRYIYGFVRRVRLAMSGGSGGIGNASTSFQLSNVLSAQEHDGYLGLMVEEKHPIYDARYDGAKLTGE